MRAWRRSAMYVWLGIWAAAALLTVVIIAFGTGDGRDKASASSEPVPAQNAEADDADPALSGQSEGTGGADPELSGPSSETGNMEQDAPEQSAENNNITNDVSVLNSQGASPAGGGLVQTDEPVLPITAGGEPIDTAAKPDDTVQNAAQPAPLSDFWITPGSDHTLTLNAFETHDKACIIPSTYTIEDDVANAVDAKKEGISMNQYCLYLFTKNDAVYKTETDL